MTKFQSFVILFTMIISIVFQVSEVYGATWVSLKYHPIRALNDASGEKGFFGANKGCLSYVNLIVDSAIKLMHKRWETKLESQYKLSVTLTI